MLLLKHIFDPEILIYLPKIFSLLQLIENKQAALELLETMTDYVISGSDRLTEEYVEKLIETSVSEIKGGGDVMPTLAEKWFSQGEKKGEENGKIEGKKEGKIEGKIEDAINMLKEGLNVDLIKKITGLPEKELIPLTITH